MLASHIVALYIRIDHRRCNVRVSEHLLDVGHIHAVLQRVRCSSVPDQMRVYITFQPGLLAKLLDDFFDSGLAQSGVRVAFYSSA